MTEQAKENLHEVIAEAVSLAVKEEMKKERRTTLGMYVVLIGIFLSIAVPLNSKLYDMNGEIKDAKSELKNKADLDFLQRSYMTKGNYHILQEEEHRYDVEAILNPKLCHEIYRESDRFRGRQLEITNRGYN